MPIYEFYCKECNTVYSFFSRAVNTEKVPLCPKCKTVSLKRQMSVFARISGKKDEVTGDELPPFDEEKMERAVTMLASEAEKINEGDPHQAAMLIRKLSDVTGLHPGPGMDEALSRMERGEDPEKIEEEMGDLLEGEEPFIMETRTRKGSKHPKPCVDETLYEL